MVCCCSFVVLAFQMLYQDLCESGISSFPGTVSFWFRGKYYQNNSLVTLEDIGEVDNALLCITDLTACCRRPYTGETQSALGNWFFPNGTRVSSASYQWDFFRTRSQSVVRLHRKRGGLSGIYHCIIPDSMNVTQTIYIGLYTTNTGE